MLAFVFGFGALDQFRRLREPGLWASVLAFAALWLFAMGLVKVTGWESALVHKHLWRLPRWCWRQASSACSPTADRVSPTQRSQVYAAWGGTVTTLVSLAIVLELDPLYFPATSALAVLGLAAVHLRAAPRAARAGDHLPCGLRDPYLPFVGRERRAVGRVRLFPRARTRRPQPRASGTAGYRTRRVCNAVPACRQAISCNARARAGGSRHRRPRARPRVAAGAAARALVLVANARHGGTHHRAGAAACGDCHLCRPSVRSSVGLHPRAWP